jgi:hypothetical protein
MTKGADVQQSLNVSLARKLRATRVIGCHCRSRLRLVGVAGKECGRQVYQSRMCTLIVAVCAGWLLLFSKIA